MTTLNQQMAGMQQAAGEQQKAEAQNGGTASSSAASASAAGASAANGTGAKASAANGPVAKPAAGKPAVAKPAGEKPAGEKPPVSAKEKSAEVLLERYRRKPSDQIRNRLVERFRSQVEAIARNLSLRLPPCVDVQDLVHAGLWGLMQAVENFRPEKGSQFMPFMKMRVRGAMLDELRNMDYLPRLYRQRLKAREEARSQLRNRLRRDPNDAELAAELGVSETRLRKSYADLPALQGQTAARGLTAQGRDMDLRSLEQNLDSERVENLPDRAIENPIEALNRAELLAKIESSLQPIEWTVLRMHYLEGMSGKEVAGKLRLSASRICQIHLRVLSRLKTRWASSAT
ncbi:MAG: sigma-70 family RNA polymerase sigma factor [Planctomycetota bacterium]|jgi:RNA polymerase sigma factor for flagellar operon FliA